MIYPKNYETVTYPSGVEGTEGWGGLQARILANPSGADHRHAVRLFRAYIAKGANGEAEDAYWQYVAPRIIEWNFETEGSDGETKRYPSPSEQWDVIYELEPTVMMWLALQIQVAHAPKPKARTEVRDSPVDAGTTDTTPPTPIHPPNSSTPSDSTLTA